ncbi:hypothetical protein HMI54_004266 [Coelomomyces lativittatus]|nr:hypothetical protein HMI56_001552 [Coelomomyces lativittatus]KAJ1511648.1 hypothetical protein HMI55_006512 [Coelomomyces lativittatus]KAJ1517760.1 hypothetical protein HMI54_004266 [Coelomomyces lativittatus]
MTKAKSKKNKNPFRRFSKKKNKHPQHPSDTLQSSSTKDGTTTKDSTGHSIPKAIPALVNLSSANPGDRAWAASSLSNLIQDPIYFQTLLHANLVKKLSMALEDETWEVTYEVLGTLLNVMITDPSTVTSFLEHHGLGRLETKLCKLHTYFQQALPSSQVSDHTSTLTLDVAVRWFHQLCRVLHQVCENSISATWMVTNSTSFLPKWFWECGTHPKIMDHVEVRLSVLNFLEVVSEDNEMFTKRMSHKVVPTLLQLLHSHMTSSPISFTLSILTVLFNVQVESNQIDTMEVILHTLHSIYSSLNAPMFLNTLASSSSSSSSVLSSMSTTAPCTLASLSDPTCLSCPFFVSQILCPLLIKGFELLANLVSYVFHTESFLSMSSSSSSSLSSSSHWPSWFSLCLKLIEEIGAWLGYSVEHGVSEFQPHLFHGTLLTVLNNFFLSGHSPLPTLTQPPPWHSWIPWLCQLLNSSLTPAELMEGVDPSSFVSSGVNPSPSLFPLPQEEDIQMDVEVIEKKDKKEEKDDENEVKVMVRSMTLGVLWGLLQALSSSSTSTSPSPTLTTYPNLAVILNVPSFPIEDAEKVVGIILLLSETTQVPLDYARYCYTTLMNMPSTLTNIEVLEMCLEGLLQMAVHHEANKEEATLSNVLGSKDRMFWKQVCTQPNVFLSKLNQFQHQTSKKKKQASSSSSSNTTGSSHLPSSSPAVTTSFKSLLAQVIQRCSSAFMDDPLSSVSYGSMEVDMKSVG